MKLRSVVVVSGRCCKLAHRPSLMFDAFLGYLYCYVIFSRNGKVNHKSCHRPSPVR